MINWQRCKRCGTPIKDEKDYCKKCKSILNKRKRTQAILKKKVKGE